MRTGAIILCGGRSTRMGRDKASLPFGPESMLARIVRLLSEVVERRRIVLVAAAHQILPDIPSDVVVARDARPERGPLEGLAAGLACVSADIDAVYVTSCDVPLLAPPFVRRMFSLLETPQKSDATVDDRFVGSAQSPVVPTTAAEYDIVVPREGDRRHPLAAVYRPAVLTQVRQLLAADQLRPRSLFDLVRTREVPVEELRSVDPRLDTLKNLNTPEDYRAALMAAGLET